MSGVDVICYGQREHWDSRDEAMKFYEEGIMCCDGSEKERYVSVYFQLLHGLDVCTDGTPERRK